MPAIEVPGDFRYAWRLISGVPELSIHYPDLPEAEFLRFCRHLGERSHHNPRVPHRIADITAPATVRWWVGGYCLSVQSPSVEPTIYVWPDLYFVRSEAHKAVTYVTGCSLEQAQSLRDAREFWFGGDIRPEFHWSFSLPANEAEVVWRWVSEAGWLILRLGHGEPPRYWPEFYAINRFERSQRIPHFAPPSS